MIFATYWFVLAVAIFLPLYWLMPGSRMRLFLLLAFCLVFHAHFAGAAGMIPIIVLAAITFAIGRAEKRSLCLWGIVICALSLCWYKYAHFLARDLIMPLNDSIGLDADRAVSTLLPITPPLAISFFTFEFVHYLFEVRRGNPAIKNPLSFLAFTFFFPCLVAGPIKRYGQFLPALEEGLRKPRSQMVALGLLQVAAGYAKKVLLADNLTVYIISMEPHFPYTDHCGRWLFLLALSLRIYFDFSGYSDIAIGLARMMGIEIPANFNWPYLATSVRDFWQRWHISLSTWIRDYIYIPLGGSRRGQFFRLLNATIAFAICGLWHGAAWHFVLWGIYHGAGLIVSSTYRKALGKPGAALGKLFDRLPVLAWALTMLFVAFGWLLFFYPLNRALYMARLLMGGQV